MRTLRVLITVLALMGFARASMAYDEDFNRRTLAGVTALEVRVAMSYPDRLDSSAVQTDTELALRRSGIDVYSGSQVGAHPNLPLLFVWVYAAQVPGGSIYVLSGVTFSQWVFLARDPSIALVTETWGTEQQWQVSEERVSEVRGKVRDMVNLFLNAYLAANPPGKGER